jgi:uncharacterized delta-60 repeat protein
MKKIFTVLICLVSFVSYAQQSGVLDATFDYNSNVVSRRLDHLSETANNKYLISGRYINGFSRQARLVRLKYNGEVDSTFVGYTNSFTNFTDTAIVHTFVEQPDGKILVGGRFLNYATSPAKNLCRLLPNGQLDNTFNTTTGFDNFVKCIKLLPNGQMYVGGSFTSYKGFNSPGIVRINSDATVDTSFQSVNGGFNMNVNDIEVDALGNVIAVGEFFMYGLDYVSFIARLDSSGTLDQTFNAGGSGVNYFIRDVDMLPNNKILIAGEFTDINGVSLNRIAKLNSDGTVDNTFTPLSSINGTINAAFVQPDNAIMIGGEFTEGIMRLNSTGTFDNSFNPGSGVDSSVTDVIVQSDNKVVLCGNFTSYNTVAKKLVARALSPSIEIDTLFSDLTFCVGDTFQIAFTPSGTFNAANSFRVQLSNANGTFINPPVIGLVAGTMADTILCVLPNNLISGQYRIRVISTAPFIVGSQYNSVLAVYAPPTPAINLSYDTLSVDSTIYTSYQWFYNDTAITGATSPTYIASQNGTYNLQVSIPQGCIGMSTDFTMITVGLKNRDLEKLIHYPSPASHQLIVQQNGVSRIEMYSLAGELVKSITTATDKNRIDVSDLNNGIYLLKAYTINSVFTDKVIVQK